MRTFFRFLIILILSSGIFVLVTNGIYFWFSQPVMTEYNDCKAALADGLPATASDRQARLTFYQDLMNRLNKLPAVIDDLNHQPWTFAVLIREDLSAAVPTLIDQARNGRQAVETYFAAIDELKADIADFKDAGNKPADGDFIARLNWFAGRIKAVAELEDLYGQLAQIPDIQMAGQLISRSELGLDAAAGEIAAIRQPVGDLETLVSQSDKLEAELDELYAVDPNAEDLGRVRSACGPMLARQNDMITAAQALRPALPVSLQSDLAGWQAGLTERAVFIEALQEWWRDSILLQQSLASAVKDRATAKRYIEDSLAEENVETAYLWTKTAEQYRLSMTSALEFANIYISRANEKAGILNNSRPAYRVALGMDPAVRPIGPIEEIVPEAFWLAE